MTNKQTVPGRKDDFAKPAIGLISPIALMEEGLSMAYGAKKYAKHNYLGGMEATRFLGAMMRHALLLLAGEKEDAESGIHHIGHIRANATMFRDCEAQGTLVDDRPYNDAYRAELRRLAYAIDALLAAAPGVPDVK